VVEKVRPAVVYIGVEVVTRGFLGEQVIQGSGSGVIFSPDGYILTNNHVVEDARRIEVTLPDKAGSFPATIVGTDHLSDLAVIKIEAEDLRFVQFGDPSQLRVGDWVVAIGNPLGTELGSEESGPAVTVGIVSNLERSFYEQARDVAYYDLIQTDAAINPGNSGGPLVNLEGKVVGINTFIFRETEGIGFAVGATTAQRVYSDLVAYGRVLRPYLGVFLDDVTPALAAELKLYRQSGVLIVSVSADSPAGRAGLQQNDVVARLGEEEVTRATQMIKLLWLYRVGDQVQITYWRGKEEKQALVTLAERP